MAEYVTIKGKQLAMSDETLDVTADNLVFKDADDVYKIESVDDIITAIAGDGLKNSSSLLALDLNELTGAVVDVANDSIAIVDAGDSSSKKESIVDLVTAMAGDGLTTDADGILDVEVGDGIEISGDAIKLDLKANDGLKIDTAELTIDYDDSTIGIITNKLAVKNEGITEAKLAIHSAPTDGYVLYWNDGESKLDYKDIDVLAIMESDIKYEDETANCDGANTTFTLGSTPVVNSVMVFLNGIKQIEGSGKSFTLTGTTVEFANAPADDATLDINYIATA